MFDPDRAIELLEAIEPELETEKVPLEEALGRALAEEVLASEDSPPFPKAAMDGYAVGSGDPGPSYRLVQTIAAGEVPEGPIRPGECAKIMTGAMMPAGTDLVIRVEYTRERNGVVTVHEREPHANVVVKGENLKAGERVLGPRILRPQDIGILASLGRAEVRVAVSPRVGILATGSELRDPGESLEAGQIYNSNGPQMCAQAAACGARVRRYGIVRDEPGALREAVAQALEECNLVLLSGGVSMGELDLVPETLAACGAEILFHKLAIKPGKPTLFARRGGGGRDERYLFGLPGNPVSAFVIFEVLVKVLLHRLLGLHYVPRMARARLAETVKRRDAERLEYRPVRMVEGKAYPVTYHGSAHLAALGEADALLRIERGVLRIEEGSEVDARLL